MMRRTIQCDVCGTAFVEVREGDGFPGWGQLHGVALNGSPNPHLCPDHLSIVAEFVDRLAEKKEV